MGRLITRIIGFALIIAGLAGLVFAGAGLFVLVQVERNIVSVAQEQVAMVDQALSATADGLEVANLSLVQAVDTVKTLESTVAGVGDTVASSVPVVDSVATLLGEQLPATIQTTQKTLESVAASSKTIDELLAVMSAIPFLGVDAYAPEVPLSQGFLDVAAGLEGIPESLQTTREQLLTMNESLAGLEGGFDAIAENVGQIATSVGSAHTVLQEYGGVIDQLKSSVGWMSKALPTWVKYLRLGVSALLIWLGIAQFALITQGWELIGRSRRREPEAATTG